MRIPRHGLVDAVTSTAPVMLAAASRPGNQKRRDEAEFIVIWAALATKAGGEVISADPY
jgi:hypothetical protein